MDKVLLSKIEQLAKLEELECDGLTRAINYLLLKYKVKHTVYVGTLTGPKGSILHYWIELEDGSYLDYRARMWQGNYTIIPDGIFNAKDFDAVQYEIKDRVNMCTREGVYNLLVGYSQDLINL